MRTGVVRARRTYTHVMVLMCVVVRACAAAGVEEYVRCACECELTAADEAVAEKEDENDRACSRRGLLEST